MIAEDLDIELVVLEDIFQEPHCDVEHDLYSVQRWCGPCTHQVVAILSHRCNGKSGRVCQEVVDSAGKLENLNLVCRGCQKHVDECWVFLPI